MGKEIDKKLLKKIFENMEYETDVKEGWDLALGWIKRHKNKFYSTPDITIETVCLESEALDVCEAAQLVIEVNVTNDYNISQLISECECGLKEWSNLTGIQKAQLLNRLPAEIEKNTLLICQLEMKIRNLFSKDTKNMSLPALSDYFQYYAGWASQVSKFKEYEPCGICLFSFSSATPLALIAMVLVPCLAAGNVAILSVKKELIPICFLIKELCINVGLPRNVIKIVKGNLQSILNHKSINKLTYIGDLFSEAFRTLKIQGKKSFNSLHLGKGTMLVFDSSDLDSACESVIGLAMNYRGFYPWAVSHIFVQETVFDVFQEKFNNVYKKTSTTNSACHKNADIIKGTVSEILFGYREAGSNVLLNYNDPTLKILPFRNANEGVALGNNSRLGLAASIWTENVNLANEVAAKLKVSNIWFNTHGHVNPGCTFSPYKKSGKGYFGGKEGLFEYLKYSKGKKIIFKISPIGEANLEDHLPSPPEKKHMYLYYGGSFKKSDSGLMENNAEYPNRKDVKNIVECALKAQSSWNNLATKNRGQFLRRFADNCSSCTGSSIASVVECLYEWATISHSISSLNVGSPTLISVKEPCGIIVIELYTDSEMMGLKLISAALSCGNAVIIVNKLEEEDYLRDVCTKCNLPPGVFNVINNPNEEVISALKFHQEIQAYFMVQNCDTVNISTLHVIHDMAKINVTCTESIINAVTKTKCIWTSNGESFL